MEVVFYVGESVGGGRVESPARPALGGVGKLSSVKGRR